jgi:hypothetical protein
MIDGSEEKIHPVSNQENWDIQSIMIKVNH